MAGKYDHHVASVKAALPYELVSRFDDSDYKRALTARHGNIIDTTALLQRYAHIRLDYASLYDKMTVQNVERLLDHQLFAFVSGLKTRNGQRVMYYDCGSWDMSIATCEESFSAFIVVHDMMSLVSLDLVDPGYIVLTDMSRMTTRQMTACTHKVYSKALSLMFESMICHPVRHVNINYSMANDMTYKAAKLFLPKCVTENTFYLKKEKLVELLGQDVVDQKRYVPTAEDVATFKKLVREHLPLIMAKYQRIVLDKK